jgi:outer membrane protein assembly factor BamB
MSEEGTLRSTPVAADVDRDGRYEILVGGADGNLHILNEKGKQEWRFVTPTSGELTFTFPVADINGDSGLETCFMDDELIYCLDLYEKSVKWTFKPENPNHYSNYNTFADVTGDGEIDVLIVAPCLYVLSNKGTHEAIFRTEEMRWEGRAENGMWSGDLNGDGLVEILVKFEGDGLYCLATEAPYNESLSPWAKSLCNIENRPVIPLIDE